jgi:hypothetical protein
MAKRTNRVAWGSGVIGRFQSGPQVETMRRTNKSL